ncbi:MAG: hypothetical protein JXR94_24300 [Candidatus Hydrogenedentes bacterium]|nr:hypothetical protein [Candidatus Hydrogenedentota bacterium]
MRQCIAGRRIAVFAAALALCAGPAAHAQENAAMNEADVPNPYVVTWSTPSRDSSGSMPLGNGDIGLNLWIEKGGDLLFYLGKTDAWSENARLLKLARVRISLSPNPFAPGLPFQQTLDVRDGAVTVTAGPPAAPATLRIWVDANAPVVRVEADAPEPLSVRATLECWRTQPRPLAPAELDSAYGLIQSPEPVVVGPDTVVGDYPDGLAWFHRNERSIWRNTLELQGMGSWAGRAIDPLLHRTFGGAIRGAGFARVDAATLASAAPARHHALAVYALTTQCADADAWLRRIDEIARNDPADWAPAWAAHRAWWRAFWERSWIRLAPATPDPDLAAEVALVNRGYTLQRFISACAGRGGSPIKFNGSIFVVDAEVDGNRFDADYRRWGGPYWFQNTRLAYWPMAASGDTGMMSPLFRMYADALPFATARTQAYFGHDGAFFPETMYFWGAYANDNYGWDRAGKPDGLTDNAYIRYYYSGALELTALMLEYFAYTQDTAFARDTLVPLAEAVIAFYAAHYPTNDAGTLRFEPAQGLETWQKAVDPLPVIAGLRYVIDGLKALPPGVASDAQRERWRRVHESLPALPMAEADGGPVLAPAAELLEEARNSENPELYAVFPYRLYGVGKDGLDLARRTFAARRVKGNEGWRQDDTQAALLGLAGEARSRLAARLARHHDGSRFPAFWGPNFDWIPDQDHGCNALMALQVMLMQCDGRAIRLFPAWPKDWNVEFKLHAPYNTTVEGAYAAGALQRLAVSPPERRADVIVLEPQ